MKKQTAYFPQTEVLEARDCPALNVALDGLGNMTITSASGAATVGLMLTGNSEYIITENFVPISATPFVAPGNVNILLPSAGADSVGIDFGGFSMGGNLNIDVGQGNDTVSIGSLFGFPGTIPGDVRVSGANNQLFGIVENALIGGNLTVLSHMENVSTNYFLDGAFIGGNVSILAGNLDDNITFGQLAPTIIGGSFQATLGNGTNNIVVLAGSSVGGNVTAIGGDQNDAVTLDGDIGGNAYLALNNGTNNLILGGSVGSNLTMIAGSGDDNVTFPGAVGGNVYLSLGGAFMAGNVVNFDTTATVGGSSFSYFGGSGADSLTFNGSAPLARVYSSLGAGADTFTLGTMSPLAFLYVDFGAGDDVLVNNFIGPFSFPTYFWNL